MSKNIQLTIPEPCHENWQLMTPQEQGRFCNACAKVVVDFSVMTDKEILNYFSTTSGKTCGRLAQGQLNREIVYPQLPKNSWKKYWFGLSAMLMLFSTRLAAQTKSHKPTTTTAPSSYNNKKGELLITMGLMANPVKQLRETKVLKGRITDDQNVPIVGAAVLIKGTNMGTTADVNGEFLFKSIENKPIVLLFASVGFERTELLIDTNAVSDSIVVVQMKMSPLVSGEVGVILVSRKKTKGVFNAFKKSESRCASKILPPAVKIYPNPVFAGSRFDISLAGILPGNYSVSIYDMNGNPLLQKEIDIDNKTVINESIQCDERFRSGVYVVKISGVGKTYTQQFVVQ